MLQKLSNIIHKMARKQWCYIAIFSVFTMLGNGEDTHHDLDYASPVHTEQLSYLALWDNPWEFDESYPDDSSISVISQNTPQLSPFSPFVVKQNHLQKCRFGQIKRDILNINRAIFSLQKNIPASGSEEGAT